jgi:hypothetical protein
MSWLRLRQVALVARDLDATVQTLRDELHLDVAFEDPAVGAFGLRNAVLPIGTQFLEVVSPTRDGTAAGRQLDRMGGDGGYMLIAHTDDQTPFRERAAAMGIRTALEGDHDGYQLWQLHPGDTGGSFLEIDHQPGGEDATGPWYPAGPSWQDHVCTDVVDGIVGATVAVPDVDAVSTRWRALLDRDGFDDAAISWVSGTRGIIALDLTGPESGTFTVAGVELRIHAAT